MEGLFGVLLVEVGGDGDRSGGGFGMGFMVEGSIDGGDGDGSRGNFGMAFLVEGGIDGGDGGGSGGRFRDGVTGGRW